ncbi:MAG: hypothetical protein K2N72_10775 [Oscillospiraceae bacterium]|nr:hypothetical protein [Oscillospiraceae bacterium]
MEEKVLNGENTENFSGGDTVDGGVEEALGKAYANEAENDRSRELETENMRLKGELACAKAGIPMEIAGDIISIAVHGENAGGDGGSGVGNACDLEEAVRAIYERICSAVSKGNNSGRNCSFGGRGLGKGFSGVTTGVRSERSFDDTDAALRRACGLKN